MLDEVICKIVGDEYVPYESIVRCFECKYSRGDCDAMVCHAPLGGVGAVRVAADDYCSHGWPWEPGGDGK